MTVQIPQRWLRANGIGAGWLESAVPERWLIPLNMTNLLGEVLPEYTRTPLGTTDTAQEDADNLESWVNSAERDRRGGTDYDAMTGLAVQDGEWASLVLPTVADMRKPPQYREEVTATNGTLVRTPRKVYDRDERGRPPESKGYGGRSEKRSRAAYDDAYTAWLARNHPWTTRLISATDCAPIMTRGLGRQRWECTGLVMRELYDHESLIDRGWQWEGMSKAGEMIPREHGTDSKHGDGGQIYLYTVCETTKGGTPFLSYCIGGQETWLTDGKRERAAVIDLYKEYGIEEKLWEYHYGLHFEDDPAYRGMPLLWPLVPTLLNLESMRTAINGAIWQNSFTGHTIRPDPNVPPQSYLDGKGQFRPFERPGPGETKPVFGEVAPFAQAQIGQDAWRGLGETRATLAINAPDQSQTGQGENDQSGHAKIMGKEQLMSGKRQIKEGILDCGTSIVYRKLHIACTFMKPKGGGKAIEWPVYVRDEEVLPTGESRTRTTTLALKERWVDGNYWVEASFPATGNLGEIKLAQELAMTGFATDEDVFKARGIKSTLVERAKIANYKWLQSPEGQAELQLRAAKYRGDLEREKLLMLVRAQKMTPGGTPMAAATGAPSPAPAGQVPGQTTLGSPAAQSLQGQYQGELGSAPAANDSRGVMALQAAGA